MCVCVLCVCVFGCQHQVDEEVRLEQERRVLEGKKHLVHEELFQCVSRSSMSHILHNTLLYENLGCYNCCQSFAHDQLLCCCLCLCLCMQVSEKTANSLMENEQMRRTIDIGEEEIKRRIHIAKKLIDVQKELLATHKEVKVLATTQTNRECDQGKLTVMYLCW